MDFEAFTEKMTEMVKNEVGDDWKVSIQRTLKNNGVRRTGILLKKEGKNTSPILYLDAAYERYREGTDPEQVLHEMLDMAARNDYGTELGRKFDPEQIRDYQRVKEHLRLQLINLEMNRELLKDVPYIRWNDLAVIFYLEIENLEEGCARIIIKNNHIVSWNKTVDRLYEDALKNMKEKLPGEMCSIESLFQELTGLQGKEDPSMYVLTNRTRYLGAAAMLYSGKLRELADEIDSDIVILPSSLHEVLLLPDQEYLRDRWRELVREVNRSFVEPEEVLSDNIYHYSRERDAVELLQAG